MTSRFFFFNDTATTEIYTLSLHDALPISPRHRLPRRVRRGRSEESRRCRQRAQLQDRKSTRLNSSHSQISYAVFCLKKKKEQWSVARRSAVRETPMCAGAARQIGPCDPSG